MYPDRFYCDTGAGTCIFKPLDTGTGAGMTVAIVPVEK